MRIKKGFALRNVCGENIVISEGCENIDFHKLISMNESSALLWKAVEGREFTANDLVNTLLENYEVDKEQALNDSEKLISQWLEAGIIEH